MVEECNHVVRINTILTITFTCILPLTMNLSSGYIDKTSYAYEQSRLKGHPAKRTPCGGKACCGQVTHRLQGYNTCTIRIASLEDLNAFQVLNAIMLCDVVCFKVAVR